MAKKAAWIVLLLVALLVISVSAAFAASATRPAHGKLSTVGATSVLTLKGASGGRHTITDYDEFGGCHRSESSPAY